MVTERLEASSHMLRVGGRLWEVRPLTCWDGGENLLETKLVVTGPEWNLGEVTIFRMLTER